VGVASRDGATAEAGDETGRERTDGQTAARKGSGGRRGAARADERRRRSGGDDAGAVL